MHPFFQEYLEHLTTLHRDMITVLDRLPQAALDWSPSPVMNSIAVLVAHTAGAERYWIGDMTVRQASQRVRANEFEIGGLDHQALKALLDEATRDAEACLAQLTVAALTEERSSLNSSLLDGERYTVAWSLLHALEHTATHVGHVQLMGDMWETLNPAT